ncbi:MAG: hypothetical protein WBL28_09945 [Methylotenera sp.]
MTLLDRLRKCVTDERELEPVLLYASGGGTRQGLAGSIEYLTSTPENETFVRVKFNRERISHIYPGPSLSSAEAQDALVERARVETAHIHGTFVASRVLFSERQLRGVYAWGNEVRISPCPSSAPIGKGLDWFDHGPSSRFGVSTLGPPFPFLLEVRIQRTPNPFLESDRTLRQLDVYQYLFTLLLTGRIRFAHWSSDRLWAILKRDNLPENHLVHTGFSTNEDGRQDDFVVREHDSAPLFEGDDYYDHLWPQDAQLFVPNSLGTDIELFHSLSHEATNAFVRACYWYALGIQFHSETSLATVAFSTAIECLLPRLRSHSCKECGKPLGSGPTQLFKGHVKRFGTVIAALQKRRNELYDVRSALVHGSHASRVDMDFMSANRHSEDHHLLLEIVCQRSLINWLRDPERATWHNAKEVV